MTGEEMEKTMQFILEQQAQFAVNQQKVGERVAQLESVVTRLANFTLDRFDEAGKRLDDVDSKISVLVDAQIQTDDNLKRTNESLRNLIAVVDRYFSERRDGES